MLKVYFVADTRAGRVIWLLEELGLEYEVVILPFTKAVSYTHLRAHETS